MASVEELSSQAAQLQQQLAQIEADKKQAAQQERDEKLGLITVYENEAQGFRYQAVKADSDADKQRLYRFAAQADSNANDLRLELGLVSEEQLQASNEDRQQREHLKASRQINALFFKAVFAFLAYLITDFTSARLELGFICFALKSIAQVSWCLSVAFGGIWIVCSTLFGFVSNYGFSGLRDDFRSLTPGIRLGLLVALLLAILHFFNGIISNAI